MSTVFERSKKDRKNLEQHTDIIRHLRKYDLKDETFHTSEYPDDEIPLHKTGGVPLYWDTELGHVYTDPEDNHTVVIGPIVSKTNRLITIPSIRMMGSSNESMIILDPGAKAWLRTSHFLKEHGYHIWTLDLKSTKCNVLWNPLSVPYSFYCQNNIDTAYEFITDLAVNLVNTSCSSNELFIRDKARMLFIGLTALLFKYCSEFNQPEATVHIGNILRLREQLFSDTGQALLHRSLWQYVRSDPHIYPILNGLLKISDDIRIKVLSVFDQQALIFSTHPRLVQHLSNNEIIYDQFFQKTTALFLIMPEENTAYYPLFSLFIKQSYEYLSYRFARQKEYNSTEPNIRLNYILDGFSLLPKISNFSFMLTTAREKHIRFHILAQSKHQLFLKYGEDTSNILSGCANWICFASREWEFLEELSRLCGEKNHPAEPKRVLSVMDLQRLDPDHGEVLILSGKLKPYLTRLPDIEVYDQNKVPEETQNIHALPPAVLLQIDTKKIAEKLHLKQEPGPGKRNAAALVRSSFALSDVYQKALIPLIDERIKKTENHFILDRIITEICQEILQEDKNTEETKRDGNSDAERQLFDKDFHKMLAKVSRQGR